MSKLTNRIERVLDRLEWTANGITNIVPSKAIDEVTLQAWSSDLFEAIVLLEDLLDKEESGYHVKFDTRNARTGTDGYGRVYWVALYNDCSSITKRDDPNLRAQDIVKRYVKRKRHEEER